MKAALTQLHVRGFLHRDVNSGNFLMQTNGQLVVIDLGLAENNDTTVGCDTTGSPMFLSATLDENHLFTQQLVRDEEEDLESMEYYYQGKRQDRHCPTRADDLEAAVFCAWSLTQRLPWESDDVAQRVCLQEAAARRCTRVGQYHSSSSTGRADSRTRSSTCATGGRTPSSTTPTFKTSSVALKHVGVGRPVFRRITILSADTLAQ